MASDNCTLHLSGIVEESIVDGPGLRYVVFVQGCPHHCPGCQNPKTHPFSGGFSRSITSIYDDYKENPLLSGITFSGGEPFCQPEALAQLGQLIHTSGGHVITYTGFTYEQLCELAHTTLGIRDLLSVTDWLIDGPFKEEERDLELAYRGSRNQRIISLKNGSFHEYLDFDPGCAEAFGIVLSEK